MADNCAAKTLDFSKVLTHIVTSHLFSFRDLSLRLVQNQNGCRPALGPYPWPVLGHHTGLRTARLDMKMRNIYPLPTSPWKGEEFVAARCSYPARSDVEITHFQRVLFDEFTPRF